MNKVILMGRLTRDPEVRYSQGGENSLAIARYTLAVDRRFNRNQGGDNQQTADFIRCVAWRQTADFLGMYAKKGALVGVDGRIQTGSYERNGQTVYTTDVYADNVRLLESRQQSQNRTQNDSFDSYQPSYNQQPAQPSYNSGNTGNDDFGSDIGFDISSDDLPF